MSPQILLELFATVVAVNAVTWCAILKQFAKNYDFSSILPQNASLCKVNILYQVML